MKYVHIIEPDERMTPRRGLFLVRDGSGWWGFILILAINSKKRRLMELDYGRIIAKVRFCRFLSLTMLRVPSPAWKSSRHRYMFNFSTGEEPIEHPKPEATPTNRVAKVFINPSDMIASE